MRSLTNILARSGILILFALHLAACGQDNWVKEVETDLYADQGVVWSEVHVYMHTGNIGLGAFNLPIMAPNRTGEVGRVSLQPVLGTDYINHVLSLLINFSELAKIPKGIDATLPNGDPIPLGGVDKNSVLALPIGETGAKVYIYMNSGLERVAVGVALPLIGLQNPTGQKISAFLPVALDSHIKALFGMFFGHTASSNGFAVFVDAQGTMKSQALGLMAQSTAAPRTARGAKTTVELIATDFDSKSRRKIDQHMYNLHNQKAVLRIR